MSCNTGTGTNGTFINFVYYNDDLLKSQEEWGEGFYGDDNHHTITYTYDADANRASVTYPQVPGFSYNYTDRNQLLNLISSYDGSHVADYTYDKNGNMTVRDLYNNTSSTFGYDERNRVTSISYSFNGNAGSRSYGYDAVGNRVYAQRGDGKTDGFGYDFDNQVRSFRRDGTLNGDGTVSGGTLTSYVFDAPGNRTSAGGVSYLSNNLNEYTSIGDLTVTNGNNGNLNTYNGWTYSFNAANQLSSVTGPGITSSFYYDGLGRQVSRTVNGSTIYSLWDGGQVQTERTAGNVITNRWSYAGSDLVRSGNPSTTYYYPDALGSIVYMANGQGTLQERYTYDLNGVPTATDAYGNPLTASVDHLFAGQKWYAQLSLYDLRARYFKPDIGRFLQPDPIGFKGDPTNLYRYCGNNPATLADPMGTGPNGPLPTNPNGSPRGSTNGDLVGRSLAAPANGSMWFIGYDGNIGAGIYVFSQGHLGFPLPDGTVFGGPGNPSGRSLDGVPVRNAIPLSQSYAPKTTNPILVELIDIAATIEGVIGDAVGIAELPVRVIGGIADRSWDEVRVAFTSAITPKYGAYAGPGWGGETAGGLPPLDNAIDIASQAHDQAYAAAKSDIGPANSGYSNAIRTADGQLIQDAYAGPVGIFGSVYRAGLNAIFTAKIALTPPE